jgi:hypothetical protein
MAYHESPGRTTYVEAQVRLAAVTVGDSGDVTDGAGLGVMGAVFVGSLSSRVDVASI